jgi:carbamoyltransferase
MKILGISAFYHDSAAVLLTDGTITAAAQEERFSRIKHDSSFPAHAVAYCLAEAHSSLSDIDFVTFYDKPFLKFERLLETYLAFAPKGFRSFKTAMPLWLKEKLFQKDLLRKELEKLSPETDWQKKLLFAEHHQSHAASAFYPSPFKDAVVLTMDGVGEWTTTSVAIGEGNQLKTVKEIHFPHSLGLLYSAFTYYTGFRVNSGEYKVMGLAPYGEAKYMDQIFDHLIDMKDDGSFRLDQSYFNYCTGLTMTNKKFDSLFGGPPRKSDELLTQRHMDLAASIQAATERIVLTLAEGLAKETGKKNLCLAGGVALNCVANGKLLKKGYFENIWIQPAAGDAGGALGAALSTQYEYLEGQRHVNVNAMNGSYLGPIFSQERIEEELTSAGAKFEVLEESDLLNHTAEQLAADKAIGWFQGRMEFGPRALGARSIIGNPRSPEMQKVLNLKVKFRESFRPFAPSILCEDADQWFDLQSDSPYMLFVADVKAEHRIQMTEEEQKLFGIEKLNIARSSIPAVTHVDYSARIQTVHVETNPKYHKLISKFKDLTDCPILVNTSFNVRGEPIVCTPKDAFNCFMGTGLDILAIGNCLLEKEQQDPSLKKNYEAAFELD